MEELSTILRARMRELGISQPLLAEMVAALLDEEPVRQAAVSRWLDDVSICSNARVFAIERVLNYAPGSISRHMGFVPASWVDAIDVPTAIRLDVELTHMARELMLGTYAIAREQSRSARRNHS